MILEVLGTVLLIVGTILVIAQSRYNNGLSKFSPKTKH